MARAISTKLGIHTVHGRPSACMDPDVKRSKVRVTRLVLNCAAAAGVGLHCTSTGLHNAHISSYVECLQVATPDGHRAPIADQLLRVRSVDTQTPCGGGANSTGPPVIGRRWRRDDVIARNSPSPVTTTTVLPAVPFDNDDDDGDSGDLDSDDDSK